MTNNMSTHDEKVTDWALEFERSIWNFNLITCDPYSIEEILDMAEEAITKEETLLPW